MGFPRQEYWIGLPFSFPRDFSDSGIELSPPASPALAGGFFTTGPPGKPQTVWKFLKKVETELLYDLAIPLLDIYLKRMKTLNQRAICTTMFTVVLFTLAT